MPSMPNASLWLLQSHADYQSAKKLFDAAAAWTYCQTISKQQQTVEKAVKAVAAALEAANYHALPAKHYYEHDVVKVLSGFARIASHKFAAAKSRDLEREVKKLSGSHMLLEVQILGALAPKRPSPGALHARNTEYPYETAIGAWRAPADAGSFTPHEVARFDRLACQVLAMSKRIVSALRRAP